MSTQLPEATGVTTGGSPIPAPKKRIVRPKPSQHSTSKAVRGGFSILTFIGRPLVWAWCLFNIALFAWIIVQSFRNGGVIFSEPFGLPESWNFDNYISALEVGELGIALINTMVVTISATVVVVALAAMAAYVLSRTKRKSAEPMTGLFILGMGIPLQAVIIPVFVMMQAVSTFMYNYVGFWDDRLSLFLVYVAINLPFAVYVLTAFFRGLPGEIEEAAALDGSSAFMIFWKIMLPLARPGITTVFILTLLAAWNETLLSLVFITDNTQYLLPQALLGLYGTMQYTSNWGGLFAGVLITVLPILLAYVFLGRRIIEGMTLGSGK